MDSYYLPSAVDIVKTEAGKTNFDHPEAFDWELFRNHLNMLKQGLTIEIPNYDFKDSKRLPTTTLLNPNKVIIIEGIFTLHDPVIRELLSLKCFLDVACDIRFIRRLQRDVKERGRSIDSIVGQYYDSVRPMYKKYLEPQKAYADLVVGEETDIASKVIAAKIRQVHTTESSHETNPLLRFRPFGGLEKIGSNISLIEYQDKVVAIDCGIQFPQDDLLGIRYLFPNISEIEKIDALIITHGHEDHIGGIIQFLRQFPNCPVYCSSFSKELILGKLAYKQMSANFEHYLPGDTIFLDDLEIKTIPVNHSIPETQGLHFTNSKKEFSLLFMSDFKIEHDSSYEKTFSIKNFPELTEKYPIKIALLDSTNILVEKRKHSEFDVENNIEKIFGQFNQRIYITTFASNLYRLISFIKLAKKFKRKVLLKGLAFIDT